MVVFENSDACVTPVLSMAEAPDHPQNVARRTFVEHLGVMQPGPAPRFTGTPSELRLPPPHAGEHSTEVLREWLGRSATDLLADGVISQYPPALAP